MFEQRKQVSRILLPFQEIHGAFVEKKQFAANIARLTALANKLTMYPHVQEFIGQQEYAAQQITYRHLTFSDPQYQRQVTFQVGVLRTQNDTEEIRSIEVSSSSYEDSSGEVQDTVNVQLTEHGSTVMYRGNYYTEGLPQTDTITPRYVSLDSQIVPHTVVVSRNSANSLMTEANYGRHLPRGFFESPVVPLRRVRLVNSLPSGFEYKFDMPYFLRRLERSNVFSLQRQGNEKIFTGSLGSNNERVVIPLNNKPYLQKFTQIVDHLESIFPSAEAEDPK